MDDSEVVIHDLVTARRRKGLSVRQLAVRTGFSVSLIEKVERGQRRATEDYIRRVSPVLGIGTPRWYDDWWHVLSQANKIRIFQPLVVPGLLQTEEYARAQLQDPARVATRLSRQRNLFGTQAKVVALLDEGVLRRGVGGAEVMANQLAHLLDHDQIVVHVLPHSSQTLLGLDGPFEIARVDGYPPLAYVETAFHGVVLTDAEVVDSAHERWEALMSEALPAALSQRLITEVVESWKNDM